MKTAILLALALLCLGTATAAADPPADPPTDVLEPCITISPGYIPPVGVDPVACVGELLKRL